MTYHAKAMSQNPTTKRSRGRPPRQPDAPATITISARVTTKEYEYIAACVASGRYASDSEFVRAAMGVRAPKPRVVYRVLPARCDVEAITAVRRVGGLLKELLGVTRALQSEETSELIAQIAPVRTQLIDLNGHVVRALERLA